ncbi:hypothetical protein KVR01_009381 [Diaporthe batatas]|uniref:uncharacterized protein n=1 Tax=Diaporthe batatas TaxID=748121 RepID=UPI001D03BEF5|nr:uncharacterized protein KVR01_009381 [Diaporthe batatas]KAG8161117.1 hypothetical protein KVR01_009381 [Diaporthe batatas]
MALSYFAVRSLQLLSLNAPVQCPVVLDGRIPQNTTLSVFDTNASPFNPGYSKGQNLSWSQILEFPTVAPSLFDASNLGSFKPLEVTIDDRSIFNPSGTNPQLGFRRAGLLLGNGSDASNEGVMTFHWSSKQDQERPLNLTHEYLAVWHETNDSSAAQFALQLGLPLGSNDTSEAVSHSWKMLDRNNSVVFTSPLNFEEWVNFAVTVDIPNNTLQVYFSEGAAPLKAVSEVLPNDNSGGGALQIGLLKKPTETKTVVFDGYQESHLNEGQIYGGLFVENSADNCVSRGA